MKKMVFVPDEILAPTPCASCTISFANEFTLMTLFGPLIICLYSIDAPVVGSMTTLAWWCSCRFVDIPVTCCAVGSTIVTCALVLYRCIARGWSYLFPVQRPRQSCFTTSFNFWFIFLCCSLWWSCLDSIWKFLISVIRFSVWIHPWMWGHMIFHPWKFSDIIH